MNVWERGRCFGPGAWNEHRARFATKPPDACRADGAITSEAYLACTVMVADRLPILVCDGQGRQVAALRAGWRGLVGVGGVGIVEQGLERLRPQPP